MYTIRFEPQHDLLALAWSGMWQPAEIAGYADALRRQFAAHGYRPGYRLLIDMSASTVQSQEAVRELSRHLGDFPKASRIAIVTNSALLRLQVLRAMPQPYLRVFDTADAALAWLREAEVRSPDVVRA